MPQTPSSAPSLSAVLVSPVREPSREPSLEPVGAPGPQRAPVSVTPAPLSVATASARLALEALMALDLDGDGRLTQRDGGLAREAGLRFAVDLELGPGVRLELGGAERLAHAADVLAEVVLEGRGDEPGLPVDRLLQTRTAALKGLLDRGWRGLVRRSDRAVDLKKALSVMPVKDPAGLARVYVPARDRQALKKLRAEARRVGGLQLEPLHRPRGPEDWKALMRAPGMLYLPRPYVVPGGRFVQMFGWDSYFNARGALSSGHPEFARDMLENQLYQIEHYGKIPNSNLSYHLSRTQPPLMPRLALTLADVPGARLDRRLLKRVARVAEQELDEVFRTGPRATPSGLSRYHDDAEGPDAEDLSHFYDEARPDDAAFHRHDRAIRESGWDMCHRFATATHHHEPVCLNSLLFQYEQDLAALWRRVDGEGSLHAARHARAARARVRTMRARFWDAERGLFFDHDVVAGRRTGYECLATFYPLWTGWASREEATRVAAALPRFLHDGGLTASSRASREAAGGENLQWDFPFGWAPHQIIAVEGLRRYGFHAEADAVAYRWLSMVLDIAGAHNGLIKEKYDVVARSADVSVEYGNQGADRGVPLAPRSERTLGFAWTNASVLLLLGGLSPGLREALDAGIPPERVLGPSVQRPSVPQRKKRSARATA